MEREHTFLSKLAQLLDLADLLLAFLLVERLERALEEVFVVRIARVLRNAVVVLASQQSGRERREYGCACAVLLVYRAIGPNRTISISTGPLRQRKGARTHTRSRGARG